MRRLAVQAIVTGAACLGGVALLTGPALGQGTPEAPLGPSAPPAPAPIVPSQPPAPAPITPSQPPAPAPVTPSQPPADLVPATSKSPGTRQVKVKVMSFNINQIRGPVGAKILRWPMSDEVRAAQARDIIVASGADVVVIDEAFDSAAQAMVETLRDDGYQHTPLVGEDCGSGSGWNGVFGGCASFPWDVNGGTMILSKFPILEQWAWIFYGGQGWDGLANKGVALVALRAPGGGVFWVAGTHLQASDSAVDPSIGAPWGKYERTRDDQLDQLVEFASSQASTPDEAVIVAGDMNIPLYFDNLASPGRSLGNLSADGDGSVRYKKHGRELVLRAPTRGSGGGVSVDCVTNKQGCEAQNAAAQYPVGYQDSLDYLGFLASKPGKPLAQSEPQTLSELPWQVARKFPPSDHYPVVSTFVLGFDDDKDDKKAGRKGDDGDSRRPGRRDGDGKAGGKAGRNGASDRP